MLSNRTATAAAIASTGNPISQIGATSAHRLTVASSARMSCMAPAITVMTLRVRTSTARLLSHFPTT